MEHYQSSNNDLYIDLNVRMQNFLVQPYILAVLDNDLTQDDDRITVSLQSESLEKPLFLLDDLWQEASEEIETIELDLL